MFEIDFEKLQTAEYDRNHKTNYVRAIIESQQGEQIFKGIIHRRENIGELEIPQDHYKKYSLSEDLPTFPCYEIEITTIPDSDMEDLQRVKINDKVFVHCTNPELVVDLYEAVLYFAWWALGSTYAILHKETFRKFIESRTEVGELYMSKIVALLKDEYNISVKSYRVYPIQID